MYVKSILDTDLYKFTTSYAYMKLFPQAVGCFSFYDRDKTAYNEDFIAKLKFELAKLNLLQLTTEEFNYVTKNIPFIPKFYWEWLRGFKFDLNKINIWLSPDTNELNITVTDELYKVSLYEVPILALVSELKNANNSIVLTDVISKLEPKIQLSNLNQLAFSEFGTRRRFSYSVQDAVCKYIKANSMYCTGTSNVHFAMKYNMKPMGTHPHEWFMFHGALYGYKQANYMALENWVNVYDGDLGIALTDTYTSEIFFTNFSKKHAKLFDGIRQDRGDEFKLTNRAIERYKQLGIDPTSKTIIFSNALTFDKALEIKNYCQTRIKCAFGIGTNLTNDTGFKPANIVMKLAWCQMNPNQPIHHTVKLSDDKGKHMGNSQVVKNCIETLNEIMPSGC